jgi:O-antigen ligase
MSKGDWYSLFILPKSELQVIWFLFLVGVISINYTTLGAIPVAVGLLLIFRMNAAKICASNFNRLLGLLSVLILAASCASINFLESLAFTANIIPFFLFFASYQYLFQYPARLRQLAWAIIFSSIPIVIIGFGQLWLGWNINLKLGSIQLFDIHGFGMPLGRMASIFYHANALANYLQVVFTFCMGLWVDIYANVHRRQQLFKPAFYWLSCYSVIILLALILTSARTGWMTIGLSILAMAIYQKWYFILGALSVVTSMLLGAAYAPDPAKTGLRQIVPAYFWARINDEMYPNRPVADTRESIFQFAWQLTLARPWSGWGLQTFGNLYREKMGFYINHPHNVLLSLSYGLGIPLTLSIFVAIGYMFYIAIAGLIYLPDCWKSERTILFTYLLSALGFLMMNMTDITIFVLPLNFLFWSILIAIYGVGKISLQKAASEYKI